MISYHEPADQAAELALTNVERVLLKKNWKKDNKALGLIQQGLSESIFRRYQVLSLQRKLGTLLKRAIKV